MTSLQALVSGTNEKANAAIDSLDAAYCRHLGWLEKTLSNTKDRFNNEYPIPLFVPIILSPLCIVIHVRVSVLIGLVA